MVNYPQKSVVNRILGDTTYSDAVCDINGDGEVNVSDVTALINYVLSGGGSPFDKTEADFNGDGVIDARDVMALYNIIKGND